MPPALNHYSHPADCPLCHGTMVDWRHKQERDGYTFGFRFCPNLKAADGAAPAPMPPPDQAADCPRRHMLPGMNNKVLAEGGAPCLLKAAHKGDCQITIEQSTAIVRMAVSQDGEKPPRILSQAPRR
ncbi:MAG: hypothetical protein ACRD72_23845 [Candidatus Angelobacter sp.]